MNTKTYDMSKLADSKKFNTAQVSLFFYQISDYYAALTNFVDTMKRCLSHYTPAFVVNSEDERANFLAECAQVRAKLIRLGASELMDCLGTLEDAAISRNFEEFSDGQVKFNATLKICMDVVKNAEVKKEEQKKEEPKKEEPKKEKNKKKTKQTIMLVDPFLMDLQKMIGFLDGKYHVIGCSDAQSAIAALQARKPDLFLISTQMPRVSGYELAYLIRAKGLKGSIWFISHEDVFDPVKTYMPSKAARYIQKPIESDSLLSMVGEELI